MGKEYPGWEAALMIRVHVICEGQTEERFVNELLVDPLASMNILAQPALIGKPGHKGGNLRFERIAFQ